MNVDKELAARLQEYTSDDVLKQEIIKETIYKEADLMANATNLVPTRNFNNLDFQMAFPDESMAGEYPLAEGASAPLEQVDWVEFSDTIEAAEVRFAITDESKVRQLDNTTADFSRRRASEKLARLKNENIVNTLRDGASTTITAGAPDASFISGMNYIFGNSNIPAMENFRALLPADQYGTILGQMDNVAESYRSFIQDGFDIEFYPSREDDLIDSDEGLLVSYSDQTAFHAVLDSDEIPLVEETRENRMDMYTVRQYFSTKVVPDDNSTATSSRIVKIDTSNW